MYFINSLSVAYIFSNFIIKLLSFRFETIVADFGDYWKAKSAFSNTTVLNNATLTVAYASKLIFLHEQHELRQTAECCLSTLPVHNKNADLMLLIGWYLSEPLPDECI